MPDARPPTKNANPMKRIDRLNVRYHGQPVGILSLTPDNKLCVFEYDKAWLRIGFSISPLELPLRAGLFIAKPTPFAGDFGIFEDSLPDGYGRYMLHKALANMGIDDRNLSVLDRLSIVGETGMGALTFDPVSSVCVEELVDDFDLLQEKALEVLRERQSSDAGLLLYNSGNSGGARPKAIFSDPEGHWLVKFRHTYDPEGMGRQEYDYNVAARNAGIDVPDFKFVNGKYFASRRFDIDADGSRIHTATAGGLMCLSLSEPVLDYRNLLSLTGFITQRAEDVEQMYRRMVFNYLTDNKDDHCKNFSFIVSTDARGAWCWRLAPAYDLTLCTEGYNGEHATSVNGRGRPTIADFIAVGTKFRIGASRCREIIREIQAACSSIKRYELR